MAAPWAARRAAMRVLCSMSMNSLIISLMPIPIRAAMNPPAIQPTATTTLPSTVSWAVRRVTNAFQMP